MKENIQYLLSYLVLSRYQKYFLCCFCCPQDKKTFVEFVSLWNLKSFVMAVDVSKHIKCISLNKNIECFILFWFRQSSIKTLQKPVTKTRYWIWITTLLFVPTHNLFQNIIFKSIFFWVDIFTLFYSAFSAWHSKDLCINCLYFNLALRLLRSWQISFSGMLWRDGCDVARYMLLLLWCLRDTGPRVMMSHVTNHHRV